MSEKKIRCKCGELGLGGGGPLRHGEAEMLLGAVTDWEGKCKTCGYFPTLYVGETRVAGGLNWAEKAREAAGKPSAAPPPPPREQDEWGTRCRCGDNTFHLQVLPPPEGASAQEMCAFYAETLGPFVAPGGGCPRCLGTIELTNQSNEKVWFSVAPSAPVTGTVTGTGTGGYQSPWTKIPG